MNGGKLIHMANEIAGFFRVYPEAEACAGIRDHLLAFWTPGMRATLLAEAGDAALDPLVAAALLGWSGAASPVGKATASAGAAGLLAGDAG